MNAFEAPLSWPRDFMLSRMLAADAGYDGAFITGVISTGIYCLPSCRARKPKPENVVFCPSTAAAQALGLRACQRCRPDDFYAGVDLTERRIVAALRSRPADVTTWASRADFGLSRLHELCRHYFQATPAEVLTAERIRAAQHLLLTGETSITQTAFDAGFESLSTFQTQFLRHTAATPSALRGWLKTGELALRLPPGYSLAGARHELGRDPCYTSARWEGEIYRARVWVAGVPVQLALSFQGNEARVRLEGATPLLPTSGLALLRGLLRLLGLDAGSQVTGFERLAARHPLWQKLWQGQAPGQWRQGLHPHGTFDAFDAAVWAVLGQVVSFRQAARWRHQLLALLSEARGGLLLPPEPVALLKLNAAAWDTVNLPARKVAALQAVARAFAAGTLPLHRDLHTAPALEKQLLALPGVGPWTARYVLLRGYGFADIFPEGDAALANAVPTGHLLPLLDGVRPYRSLAALHLWQRPNL